MKKLVLTAAVALIAAVTAFSQQKVNSNASAQANTKATASKNGNNVSSSLAAGTQIAGQLQSSLDAKNAKVGDQVVLKTTNAVKQNGQVVVQKGSKLIGHVTEVQQRAKGEATSKIGVLFDKLEQGGNSIPISAVITSITQAQASTAVGDDIMSSGSAASTTTGSTSTRSSSSSSGGLLGGVGNTVGGVVNTTTQTVGGVANTAGQTVGGVTSTAGQTLGSTTQAVGGTVRGLQISQSTDASASGGSTLSLTGGNLRLEKGATFNLSVNQSSSAKTN
jgi:hypothetical protein